MLLPNANCSALGAPAGAASVTAVLSVVVWSPDFPPPQEVINARPKKPAIANAIKFLVFIMLLLIWVQNY